MYAQTTPSMRLSNLGRKLVEQGLISEEQAIEAQAKAAEKGRTFTSHLVRDKLIDAGLDGVTLNMPANGHVEGRVELLGQTLAPLITG